MLNAIDEDEVLCILHGREREGALRDETPPRKSCKLDEDITMP